MNNGYNEELLDLAIKHAGKKILADAANETPQEYEAGRKIECSVQFEKRMKRIINRDIRKKRITKALKITSKVAVIVLIFLLVATTVVMSTEALRLEVFNFLHVTNEKSADIDIINEDIMNMRIVIPEYIPDGFIHQETKVLHHSKLSIYNNADNDKLNIEQYLYNGNYTLDTVDKGYHEFYDIEIKGASVTVFKGGVKNSIILEYAPYGFLMSGDVELFELIKIAESIIK